MPTEKNENIAETAAAETPAFLESDEDCAIFLTAKELHSGILSQTAPVPAEEIIPTRGASTKRYLALAKKLLPALPVCALSAGLCWALTLATGFDADIGHIQRGCVWFYLMLIPLLAGAALTGTLAYAARRTRQYRLPKTGVGETFTALFAATLLGFHALKEIYTLTTTPPEANLLGPDLTMPAAAALFLCVAYLLLVGLGRRSVLLAWMAMGSIVSCTLILFRDYFDFTLPLNSPVRYMTALTVMGLLLFFLSEARMHTDLWYSSAPFSVAAYGITLVLTGGAGLAQAVLALLGNPQFSLVREVAFAAIAALAFFRLRQLSSLLGDHMPPPPTEEEIRKWMKKTAK